jgi:hypothetical protein
MRTQTPKQAAAFKEKVTKAIIALGATTDEAYYGYRLETIYGGLRLSPGENSIRTRFDVVPKVHCLSGASLNPFSGKWNHEFSMKPTQDQLDYAIENIRRILP